MLILLAHDLGGLTPTDFVRRYFDDLAAGPHPGLPPVLAQLNEAGGYFERELNTDSGFTMRVVVGDLTAQEQAEWIAHTWGRLHLTDGGLLVVNNYAWYADDYWAQKTYPDIPQAGEAVRADDHLLVQLEPGHYRFDLYSHYPDLTQALVNDRSEIDESGKPKKKESLKAYFRRTRPGEPLPVWTEQLSSSYVNFVLHLTPVTEAEFTALSSADQQGIGWVRRKPEIAPLGLDFTPGVSE